jgi:hypothetical protein
MITSRPGIEAAEGAILIFALLGDKEVLRRICSCPSTNKFSHLREHPDSPISIHFPTICHTWDHIGKCCRFVADVENDVMGKGMGGNLFQAPSISKCGKRNQTLPG